MGASVRLTKPWRELSARNIEELGGHLGVYELADSAGQVVLIGYAGGRSLFGLAGELATHLDQPPATAVLFRGEITSAYLSRYRELLMAHLADHGRLPPGNRDDPARLGRLHPA
jgi:hypothetical protein